MDKPVAGQTIAQSVELDEVLISAQVVEAEETPPSPFQLFASFGEDDKDKFFGRDKEINILYQLIQEANVVLLYGQSGTGKTSLAQCGLLNETKNLNWSSITIRRNDCINDSLRQQLINQLNGETYANQPAPAELLQNVFMSTLQPQLLLFDQFEELYVFGTANERKEFYQHIKSILQVRIPLKIIFIIREEFYARLAEFEKLVPNLFKKRLRIELMDKDNSREVVIKSCAHFNLPIYPVNDEETGIDTANETDTPVQIIDKVANKEGLVHLPYLQVFLDTLWKIAYKNDPVEKAINPEVVEKAGGIGDVLKSFLEKKIDAQHIINKADAWKVLKTFVSKEGTRKTARITDFMTMPVIQVKALLDYYKDSKIVVDCAADAYELAHESLVPVIQQVNISRIREKLAVPGIGGNPYKGLESYNMNDRDRFYGRKEVIAAIFDKLKQLPFLVVAGNSGTGKSSLIKAGLFPLMLIEGYTILDPVRPLEQPLVSIEKALTTIRNRKADEKFVLLIDQYEELITKSNRPEEREKFYEILHNLLNKKADDNPHDYDIKIIITIRADFEPQFAVPPLDNYWQAGKYIIPPFSREELLEIVEEPAYQAGLEFSPSTLADNIADEVYVSQSTGLLPLMSFTLSMLYRAYITSGRNDGRLTEDDYKKLGGVIGGLRTRADNIYDEFKLSYTEEYEVYQQVMRNILIRMVSLGAGELAGQRVLANDLVFENEKMNAVTGIVTAKLLDNHLIVAGVNTAGQKYFEPAHDALVRTWGQLWNWIQKFGRETLFMQSRLAQAIEDFKENHEDENLLWDNNPWLNNLHEVSGSKNNWLNKQEAEFIRRSMARRNSNLAHVQKEQQEKILLIEEKVKEERAKNKLIEEKIADQKIKARKIKVYLSILIVILIIAVYAAFEAINKSKKIELLLHSNARLANDSIILARQRIELQNQKAAIAESLNDSLEIQVGIAAQALDSQKILAKSERLQRLIAIKAAAKTQSLNIDLIKQNLITDSVLQITVKQNQDIRLQNESIQKLVQEEKRARLAADSLVDKLLRQQDQNVTQLLTIAQSLEDRDIVKSFWAAELAYKKDSSNQEVAAFYKYLRTTPKYYYTRQMEGNFSVFSPDGQYFLTATYPHYTVNLWKTGEQEPLSSIQNVSNLRSATFSPDGKTILIVRNDEVEIRRTSKLSDKNNIPLKQKRITYAGFSPDADKILVVAGGNLYVYNNIWNEIPLLVSSIQEKEKITYAVFSPDSRRIITTSDNGKATVWNVDGGKLYRTMKDEQSVAYVSPAGNNFITASGNLIYLYNSAGEQIRNISRLIDAEVGKSSLSSATFSASGKKVVLIVNSLSTKTAEQQQKSSYSSGYESSAILLDLSTYKVQRLDGLLNNLLNGLNLVVNDNKILAGDNFGQVRCFDLAKAGSYILAGHETGIRTMSLHPANGSILTSSSDNITKIWQYNIPLKLRQTGQLPILSDEELRKLGAGL